jgi:hypothetical protein
MEILYTEQECAAIPNTCADVLETVMVASSIQTSCENIRALVAAICDLKQGHMPL